MGPTRLLFLEPPLHAALSRARDPDSRPAAGLPSCSRRSVEGQDTRASQILPRLDRGRSRPGQRRGGAVRSRSSAQGGRGGCDVRMGAWRRR